MQNSVLQPDYASDQPLFIHDPREPMIEARAGEVQSKPQTTFTWDSIFQFQQMAKAPENLSDVIANCLQEIKNVKAVLMGRSGEVYHVWTMIGEWNPEHRKAVYATQKELLAKLSGFELDFYVVPLNEGEKPEDLVSDIPVIFHRVA